MEDRINDREMFRKVPVVALNAYLSSHGWIRKENWEGRVVVWANMRGDQRAELLTPIREHSSAYSTRIAEVVSELSTWEARPPLEVYQDLIAARADVVRFRSLNGTRDDWSLVDGAEMLSISRDLVAAAARFADSPGQAVYRWRASGKVANYLRDVRPVFGLRMWQDFALHSRVVAGYGIQRDMGDDYVAPFPRQVMLALHAGLSKANEAGNKVLGGADLKKTFESAVSHGLNANLCEALAELVQRLHGVTVEVTWASVRPRNVPWNGFSFGESSIDVLRGGAEWLRSVIPFHAYVNGEVVILEREADEPFDGQAVVVCELDKKPVSLYVRFDEADHENAIRAFRQGIRVSLDGDISRTGRRYALLSPRNLSLITGDGESIL